MELQGQGRAGSPAAVKEVNQRWASDICLRLLAVATTLVAAVVMGVDKETKMIPFTISPNLPPLDIAVTAKSHYVSALKYFVAVNAMACVYSALSLMLTAATRGRMSSLAVALTGADLVGMVLLASANGAASAMAILAKDGNSHVNWHKICNVYSKFCGNALAAIGVSLLGTFFFLLVVLLSVAKLHRPSP